MVQVDFRAMQVPSADGKMRLWRNTYVANVPDGLSATLKTPCTGPAGEDLSCTLGLEWDEDSDNGFRPPGIIRASSTYAPGGAFYYLLDHGVTYSTLHDATHHVTLHRYPPTLSGALVFGAGTINWSWGLDSHHDFDTNFAPRAQSSTEPAMQQATVNLFADMGVQPRTLQPGLTAATASTDSTPPTSTITSPTNGGTVVIGSAVSITGTAVDSGGGVVGGVEVSVDGGAHGIPRSIGIGATAGSRRYSAPQRSRAVPSMILATWKIQFDLSTSTSYHEALRSSCSITKPTVIKRLGDWITPVLM
jgi:hypothetical protein